ncbi:lysozyme [Hugenholtzia roseola]|uniref:lysozyme n=1 Tax=Hugenholtzia roseola TaxID=1002 RepID=UPI0004788190|nr:lysozyme [Hugenholtzia roseola]
MDTFHKRLLLPTLLLCLCVFGAFQSPNWAEVRSALHQTFTPDSLLADTLSESEALATASEEAQFSWEDLKDYIRAHETLLTKPRACSGGYMSIGYGHVLTAKDKALYKGITAAQADSLLEHDLGLARSWVESQLDLAPQELMAITHFCYAFGSSKLRKSTLFQKLKNGEPIEQELARWVHVNGRPNAYLKKQREFEANLFYGRMPKPLRPVEPLLDEQDGMQEEQTQSQAAAEDTEKADSLETTQAQMLDNKH